MNIEDLCDWLKTTKGITKIDLNDLIEFIPEYEKYLEENDSSYTANLVECDLCTHQWTAVYHADLKKLECPNCENIVYFDEKN